MKHGLISRSPRWALGLIPSGNTKQNNRPEVWGTQGVFLVTPILYSFQTSPWLIKSLAHPSWAQPRWAPFSGKDTIQANGWQVLEKGGHPHVSPATADLRQGINSLCCNAKRWGTDELWERNWERRGKLDLVIRETFLEDFLKQARPCWVLKSEKEGREDHSGSVAWSKGTKETIFHARLTTDHPKGEATIAIPCLQRWSFHEEAEEEFLCPQERGIFVGWG